MHFLVANFDGITIDLEQGQKENAIKQYEAFKARFQEMGESCRECHQTNRKYYVSKGVQSMIDRLGEVIRQPTVDMEMVHDLSMGIGMEGCFKCHLVHIPSSIAKYQWAKWEEINANNK